MRDMTTDVCTETRTSPLHVDHRANSETLIFDDLCGCRLDASLGREPPTVLVTLLTHECDMHGLRRIAEELMHGVAKLVHPGTGIKAQFHGDHTSNCATVILTNVDPTTDDGLTDALLRVYKRALLTQPTPVYQRLVHDTLFLPSGRTVRYVGRVCEAGP